MLKRQAGREDAVPEPASAAARERRVRAVAEPVTMAAIAVLGVAVVAGSVHMGLTNALGVGPGMFPFVSGLLLVGLGLAGTVTAAVRRRTSSVGEPVAEEGTPDTVGEEPPTFTSVNWPRLATAVVLLLIFVVAMPYFGFVVTLAVLTFALMLLVARRGLVLSIVMTLGLALGVYYGFGVLLDVYLPGPTVPFLAWMNP